MDRKPERPASPPQDDKIVSLTPEDDRAGVERRPIEGLRDTLLRAPKPHDSLFPGGGMQSPPSAIAPSTTTIVTLPTQDSEPTIKPTVPPSGVGLVTKPRRAESPSYPTHENPAWTRSDPREPSQRLKAEEPPPKATEKEKGWLRHLGWKAERRVQDCSITP